MTLSKDESQPVSEQSKQRLKQQKKKKVEKIFVNDCDFQLYE